MNIIVIYFGVDKTMRENWNPIVSPYRVEYYYFAVYCGIPM